MKNIILVNEELNKWCNTEGINYYEGIEALGFLFKYAVPKLREKYLYIYLDDLTDEFMAVVKKWHEDWPRCDKDGHSLDTFETIALVTDENPALALFWAIFSV